MDQIDSKDFLVKISMLNNCCSFYIFINQRIKEKSNTGYNFFLAAQQFHCL